MIRHTVLPAVLPELFTGLRLAVGFAFTTIVAAETVDGIPGIGGLAWSTKKFQQTDVAIMCVIVIGVCAVVIDLLLRAAERRLVPWKGRVRRNRWCADLGNDVRHDPDFAVLARDVAAHLHGITG